MLTLLRSGNGANRPAAERADARASAAIAAPVIAARSLTKDYRAGDLSVKALRGVDLDIERGEFVVILGPSGSGKSTLLNLLGGMDSPSAGRLAVDGEEVAGLDERGLAEYRRRKVGFVFQFYNLMANLTAAENVELASEISVDPMRPGEALALVGLGDKADRFPAKLSGGEQQRVAVARAIAKRPSMLLCDEPTGALDHDSGAGVLRALKDANEDLGATVVVVTHNQAIAAMADRVLRMRDGLIAESIPNPSPIAPEAIDW